MLSQKPTPIPGVPGLWAMNIDPRGGRRAYREKSSGPTAASCPTPRWPAWRSSSPGACTIEIAAFDEFSRLLGDAAATADFDHVLFDTAPTGHTLRLLSLPSAWDGFMSNNTTGTSCLGPLAGLQAQQKLYQDTVRALGDAGTTTLVLVTRPEAAALREADRTSGELADLGVNNQHLVINGVFVATDPDDPLAAAMARRAEAALEQISERLARLPRTTVPLAPRGLLGAGVLRAFATGTPLAESEFDDACRGIIATAGRTHRRIGLLRPRGRPYHG